jgi:hypothetical protein
MQGWQHWLMGAGFLGFAMYTLVSGGSYWLMGLSVGASFYLFYRALHEETGAAADDLQLAVDFVRNPYDAILDEAVGQLTGEDEERPRRGEPKPGVIQSLIAEFDTRETKSDFDPDAAIARYLANRPPPEVTPLAKPVRGFGRKGA